MQRLFIVRKDLRGPDFPSAAVDRCREAYWIGLLKSAAPKDNEFDELLAANPYNPAEPALYKESSLCRAAKAAFKKGEKTFKAKRPYGRPTVSVAVEIPKEVWDCMGGEVEEAVRECEGLDGLEKAAKRAGGLGFSEGPDWGYAEYGGEKAAIWFRPLPDGAARKIGAGYRLWGDGE